MKNEYVEKINRMGKAGFAVAKICTVMLNIAMVCCIVGGVLLALVPADGVMVTTSHQAQIEMDMTHSIMPNLIGIDTEADGSFELDGIKYDKFDITGDLGRQIATASSTPYTYSLKDMMWPMLAGAVMCMFMANTLKKVSAMFETFKNCETPFTVETAEDFKKLAVAFIPVIVISWVVEAIVKRITTGVWDIVIGIDLTVVMAVVVVLMLSEIFRYGAMLQTESDETL